MVSLVAASQIVLMFMPLQLQVFRESRPSGDHPEDLT